MQKIYSIITFLTLTVNAFAQAPQKISYQAVIRNASNALVASSPVGMKISILQGSASGTVVYAETQAPTTNVNGLVSIQIGGGTPVTGTFSSINWANGPYYIKTETDPSGGTSYSITGTSQILSVPYALYAGNVPTNVSAFTNDAGYLTSEVDGSVTNEIQDIASVLTAGNNASGKNLFNVGTLAIGTASPASGVAFEVKSTTGAVLLPRMTTTERNALPATLGMVIYNTTTKKIQTYTNSDTVDQEYLTGLSTITKAGQSFTAGMTGNWTKLELSVQYSSVDTIKVYEGEGVGGALLLTQPVYLALGLNRIVFNAPVPVVSGQVYTFMTKRGNFFYSSSSPEQGNYSGGQAYSNNVPVIGDIYFKTFIERTAWVDLH
ncbi:MAG TPA: hypothetical protein VFN30_12460 [Chitinophagaceae bacterium]|nr:hypothetical protein [Chitinophagaceae bacterium]